MLAYYKDCLTYLHSLKINHTEECIDCIWINSDWKIGSHTLYSDNLVKCGIWCVHDLRNNDGSVLPYSTWVFRGADYKVTCYGGDLSKWYKNNQIQ